MHWNDLVFWQILLYAQSMLLFGQGNLEMQNILGAKLMRRDQGLQHVNEHARLPRTRLPESNGMATVAVGIDGSVDLLHESPLIELAQEDASRGNVFQSGRWGRRWRRRWRRFRRRFNRHMKRLNHAAGKLGDKYGAKVKDMMKVALKSLKACGAGAIMSAVTSNPAALANTAKCIKDQATAVKSDAKAILSDAKAEAQAQGKDVSDISQTASNAAGVVVAHIMAFGNQLEQKAKAGGNLTVAQAIHALEAKVVTETINSTVAVENNLALSLDKTGTALKTMAKDVNKASNIASAIDNGISPIK